MLKLEARAKTCRYPSILIKNRSSYCLTFVSKVFKNFWGEPLLAEGQSSHYGLQNCFSWHVYFFEISEKNHIWNCFRGCYWTLMLVFNWVSVFHQCVIPTVLRSGWMIEFLMLLSSMPLLENFTMSTSQEKWPQETSVPCKSNWSHLEFGRIFKIFDHTNLEVGRKLFWS